MRNRTLLGIALALLLVSAGTGAFLLLYPSLTHMDQQGAVTPTPYVVQRSEEVPASTHRAISMAASTQTTASLPWGVALDYLNGFTWVAEPGCEPQIKCPANIQGVLGQYALSDGAFIQNLNEPKGYSSPLFLAVDKAGDVWFTQPETNAIGEYNPQTQSWNRWNLKTGKLPFDLTFDRNGNLWFTEFDSNTIGFFNPRTHTIVETPTPTTNSNPYGIAIDPSGNIWFSENGLGVDQIGGFTPTQSGSIKVKEYPVGNLRPHLIATDNAGNIWYSGGFGGDLGEFNPRSGNATQFSVSQGICSTSPNCVNSHISGVAADSNGHIWFTDSISRRVGYLVPSTGQVVAITVSGSNPHPNDGLVTDSNERVWFTEEYELTLKMLPASTV